MIKYRFLALFLAVFGLVGCGGDASAPATPSAAEQPAAAPEAPAPVDNAALIAEGKELFGSGAICFSCHGAEGAGTQLAPDLTDDEWLHIEGDVTEEKIISIMKNGIAEPKQYPAPMPAVLNLTDPQLAAVAAYVLTL